MKKSAVLSLLMMIASLFLFTSCAQNPNFSGEFSSEELIYSIGEEVDFFGELKLKGISKEEVEFSLSSGIALKTNNIYKMTKAGSALLTATSGDLVLASTTLVVKDKFSSPKNLTINENGYITWDVVVGVKDNQVYQPDSYTVVVNGVLHNDVRDTRLELTEEGIYSVEVKANASKYFDGSEYSSLSNFEYRHMTSATNIILSSSNSISTNMTLSWDCAQTANFDVLINGVIVAQQINKKSVELDFNKFDAGAIINASIIVNDNHNKIYSSKKDFVIKKPYSPSAQAIIENYDGVIRWNEIEGATKYIVEYTNLSTGAKMFAREEDLVKANGYVYYNLAGAEKGNYNLRIQAKGGMINDRLYTDSNIEIISDIVKLEMMKAPEFSYHFTDTELVLDFAKKDGADKIIVEINGVSQNPIDVSQGLSYTLLLSDIENDDFTLSVRVIPNQNQTNTLSSDKNIINLYKLKDISNFKHTLEQENSVLTFDKIENADKFEIKINGEIVTNFERTEFFDEETQITKTILTIPNLANFNPIDNAYKFELIISRQDGNSNVVKSEKAITILGKPEKSSSRVDGLFDWSSLADSGVKYDYTIFSSNASQEQGEILKTNSTIENIIKQEDKLEFGYYIIKVEGKSDDTDKYLDANFGGFNENNFLQEFFHVEKQISSPKLLLEEKNGKYIVKIQGQEFAGKYIVKLDDQDLSNGTIVPSIEQDYFECPLESTLPFKKGDNSYDSLPYKISVVAQVGNDGDATLHPQSEVSQLLVYRLPTPEFSTSDVNGEQKLVVKMANGVKKVEIKEGETLLNIDESNEISLKSLVGLSHLSFKFIAKDREEDSNIMYLESAINYVDFSRLDTPTNLAFSNGQLSFISNSHDNTSIYKIQITLVNSVNGNKVWETQTIETTFDLNGYVENMRSNPEFMSDYANCSGVLISVQAYNFDFIDGVFYLPSDFSQSKLLEKLDSPVIYFDTQTLRLSWNKVEKEGLTTYSIYVDGVKYNKEDITGLFQDLTDLDFLQAKEILVFAENSNYLSSAYSNKIVVRKLNAIDKVSISGNNLVGHIPSSDLNQTQSLMVNDVVTSFNTISGVFQILLENAENNFAIKLVAKPQERIGNDTYYYISSQTKNYKLISLESGSEQAVKDNEKIYWPALAQSFVGNLTNPLSYTLTLFAGEAQLQTFDSQLDTQILFNDERIFNRPAGDYKLKVEGVLKDYVLSSLGQDAVGYYGKKDLGTISYKKLQGIQDFDYSVKNASGNLMEERLNGEVVATWTDVWGDSKNTMFDIEVDLTELPEEFESYRDKISNMFKNLKDGSKNDFILGLAGFTYSLKLTNGQYVFTLSNKIADLVFGAGTTEFPIFVHSNGNINSTSQDLTFKRLYSPSNAKISGDGVLSFTSSNGSNRYVISIKINEGRTQYFETTSTSIDLMNDYIKDTTGIYFISVLADDTTNEYLPAHTLLEFEGRRLQGVTNVLVEETGNIAITIADEGENQNLEFIARFKDVEKIFIPRKDENNDNVYHYSTAEFVLLFGEEKIDSNFVEINLSVRLQGKINSPQKSLTFGFNKDGLFTLEQKREIQFENGVLLVNKSKNYLVIKENIDITTGLWIEYHYFAIPESEDEENPSQPQEVVVKIPLSTSSIKGWWVTNNDGSEYFTTSEPAELSAIKCFALNIDEVLKELGDGDYSFFISRICKDGDLVIQYGTSKITYSKLPAIDETQVRLNNEILVWRGSEDARTASYYLNLYTKENGEYKFFTQREVTTTTNFDLTQIISDTTRPFYLTITSLPSLDRKDLLPSLASTVFTLQRNAAPVKLENYNGTLQFNVDSIRNMQLLKDIENNYTDYKVLGPLIAKSTYNQPFTFSVNRGNISSINVKLKFVKVVDGNESENYFVTVKALDLLAYQLNNLTFGEEGNQISYMNILINLSGSNSIEPSDRETVRKLVEDIQSSKFGLANSKVLFDDFGRHIPAGNYNVYIRQEGVPFDAVNREGVIPSEYSNSTFLNVAPAPEILLDREGSNGVYSYYLYFKPVDIQSLNSNQINSQQALAYKLNLRVGSEIKEFNIVNNDGTWQLLYQNDGEEESLFDLDDSKRQGYIAINLTRDLSRKIANLSGEVWNATIYAVGNDFTLNSKSNPISMEILDFNYQSLRLDNGMLSWISGSDNGTRISYKAKSSTPDVLPVISGKGLKNLNLPYAGQYDYIIFMARGGYSENSVIVDSETYKLENLYVRAKPDIKVEEGNFVLKNKGNEDKKFANFTQFNVTNNISKKNNLWTKTNKFDDVNKEIQYILGVDEKLGKDELNATKFEITSSGNSIELTGEHASENHFVREKLENDANNADYILKINENSTTQALLIESESQEILGSMLPSIQNAKVKDGHLVWDDVTTNENFKPLNENSQVLYKVSVYYFKTIDAQTYEQKDVFYTSENAFDCKLISDNRNFKYYSISVTTIACDKNNTDNRTAILYDDGTYALTSEEMVFGNKTLKKVDAPQNISIKDNEFVIRYYPQEIDINNNTVSPNKISFKLFERNSGKEISGKLHGLNSSEEETENFVVNKEGETPYFDAYFLPDDNQILYENSGNYYVTVYAYRPVEEITLENAELISHPTALPDAVYKLKAIQEDDLDFDYNLDNDTYTLSFERYFETYRIGGRKDIIQIQMLLETQQGNLTYRVLSSNPQIILQVSNTATIPVLSENIIELPEGTKVSFKVSKYQNVQDGIITPLLILGSDTCFDFTLNRGQFGSTDSVDWDSEKNNVYWSSTIDVINGENVKAYYKQERLDGSIVMTEIDDLTFKANQKVMLTKESQDINGEIYIKAGFNHSARNVYFKQSDIDNLPYLEFDENGSTIARQYFVVVYFNDGTSETSKIIKTNNPQALIYQPDKNGTITRISVYVKDGKFSLFSQPIEKEGVFDYKLFDSGLGTKEDPYIIANQKQFKNIALRNSSSDKSYFRLKNDITLNSEENGGFVINSQFYGELDCNNKIITLNLNGTSTIDRVSHIFLPATENREYRYSCGAGLFTSVENNASISNLKLKVNINILDISSSLIVAPIAITNSGKIENIEIIEYKTNLTLTNLDVKLALSGLVDTNYNIIQNVNNNADVNLYANGEYLPNIVYSGVAIQNQTLGFNNAVIKNCVNNGQVLLLAKAGQNGAKLMASGIVGVVLDGAQVLNCGNNGNIALRGQGVSDFIGYSCGVSLRVSSGENDFSRLENIFNNGSLTLESQSGNNIQILSSDNIAGIAHTIQGGTILSGLVDTARQKLAVNCSSSVTASGCFASVSVQNLSNASLSETQTNAVDGWRVQIKSKADGGYIASLLQA